MLGNVKSCRMWITGHPTVRHTTKKLGNSGLADEGKIDRAICNADNRDAQGRRP